MLQMYVSWNLVPVMGQAGAGVCQVFIIRVQSHVHACTGLMLQGVMVELNLQSSAAGTCVCAPAIA